MLRNVSTEPTSGLRKLGPILLLNHAVHGWDEEISPAHDVFSNALREHLIRLDWGTPRAVLKGCTGLQQLMMTVRVDDLYSYWGLPTLLCLDVSSQLVARFMKYASAFQSEWGYLLRDISQLASASLQTLGITFMLFEHRSGCVPLRTRAEDVFANAFRIHFKSSEDWVSLRCVVKGCNSLQKLKITINIEEMPSFGSR